MGVTDPDFLTSDAIESFIKAAETRGTRPRPGTKQPLQPTRLKDRLAAAAKTFMQPADVPVMSTQQQAELIAAVAMRLKATSKLPKANSQPPTNFESFLEYLSAKGIMRMARFQMDVKWIIRQAQKHGIQLG